MEKKQKVEVEGSTNTASEFKPFVGAEVEPQKSTDFPDTMDTFPKILTIKDFNTDSILVLEFDPSNVVVTWKRQSAGNFTLDYMYSYKGDMYPLFLSIQDVPTGNFGLTHKDWGADSKFPPKAGAPIPMIGSIEFDRNNDDHYQFLHVMHLLWKHVIAETVANYDTFFPSEDTPVEDRETVIRNLIKKFVAYPTNKEGGAYAPQMALKVYNEARLRCFDFQKKSIPCPNVVNPSVLININIEIKGSWNAKKPQININQMQFRRDPNFSGCSF